MWVILSVSTGAKRKGITAGIAVGSVIGLEAMFAGPISCGSIESIPFVRTCADFDAPSKIFGSTWLHPLLGALLAVPVCRLICPENVVNPLLSSPNGRDPIESEGM